MYGLAKIQRGSKYPIVCAPEYSRNLLSTVNPLSRPPGGLMFFQALLMGGGGGGGGGG